VWPGAWKHRSSLLSTASFQKSGTLFAIAGYVGRRNGWGLVAEPLKLRQRQACDCYILLHLLQHHLEIPNKSKYSPSTSNSKCISNEHFKFLSQPSGLHNMMNLWMSGRCAYLHHLRILPDPISLVSPTRISAASGQNLGPQMLPSQPRKDWFLPWKMQEDARGCKRSMYAL